MFPPQHSLQPKPSSLSSLFSLSTPRHSPAQCCLISIIQLNRLRSNIQQLRQYINKQLQTMKNGLSLISIGYQSLIQEIHNKYTSILNEQKQKHQIKINQQELINIKNKIQSDRNLNDNKQKCHNSISIKQIRAQYEQERQKMNLRINQLYSIIRKKNQQIETINKQLDSLKKVGGKHKQSIDSLKIGDSSSKQNTTTSCRMMGIRKSIDLKKSGRLSSPSKDNSAKKQQRQKQGNVNLKVFKKSNKILCQSNTNNSFINSKCSSRSKSKPKFGMDQPYNIPLNPSRKTLSISSRNSNNHNKSVSNNMSISYAQIEESPFHMRQYSISTETAEKIGDIISSIQQQENIERVKKLKTQNYLDRTISLKNQPQKKSSEKKLSIKKNQSTKSVNSSLKSVFESAIKAFTKTQKQRIFK